MKCSVINVVMGLFIAAMVVLAGCGGSSSESNGTASSLITNVGWLYDNAAPDYFDSSATCLLSVKVYYSDSIAAADIDSFNVTSPNGWKWTITASSNRFGTSSSGNPYISGNLYYGANPYTMPLAGTWDFQLKLKNGQTSSLQRTLHEPGSSTDATHQYLYTEEDWTPSTNPSQYTTALGRFPSQGYTLQYSATNGGKITTSRLSAVRTNFLAREPRAYNMVCWLYDANKGYLGYTTTEFSSLDHSSTNLITSNGELLIVPASTQSSNGQIDLSTVKYLRFVYLDGRQYESSSYSNSDYRSISSLVAVNSSGIGGVPTVSKISAGSGQSLYVKNDGTVRAWGFNGYGELGNATTINSLTPVQVAGLTGIIDIAAGSDSYALKNDGTVWAWGYNGYGQLGNGTYVNSSVPVKVSGLSGVGAISAGNTHAMALKNDGTVWAWGQNDFGKLGNGTTVDSTTPVQAIGLSGIITISAGTSHSMALKNDGTVWVWGDNTFGQLGNGTTGSGSTTPVMVSGLTGITSIATGRFHALALKNDGTVWVWCDGFSSGPSPAKVNGISGIVALAAGDFYSLLLKNDGTVWAWGQNNTGKLGNGTTTDSYTPVQVTGLTGVTAIAAGIHSLALTGDGKTWAWGYNAYGGLGNGTTTNSTIPIEVIGL